MAGAGTVTYTYDSRGRLLSAVNTNGSQGTYTYDKAGNRTQVVIKPLQHNPSAVADSIAVTYQTAKTFDPRANDSDPDGDSLTITAVTVPSHGTATFTGTGVTYTPANGYSGSDAFSYTISDGRGGSASATVTVTVAANPNHAPVANADGITTYLNTGKSFDPRVNDSDPDGDPLTVSAVSTPAHGTTSFTSTGVTYTPTTGYRGADSFTYTISDGRGLTGTATVSVSISNRAPVAGADAVSTNVGTAVSFDPRLNDTDPDGDGLTVSSVAAGAHGATTSTSTSITYTPAVGYHGADSFTYQISDGAGGTATATVSVSVTNRAPTAGAVSISTPSGTAIGFDPRGNDSDLDGDSLTITGVSPPGHGSATTNGSSITYTPTAGYHGSDSFTYTISDGYGGTAIGTVSATLTNRGPAAGADSITTNANAAISFDPRANDSDPDGDGLTVTAVGIPGHGTASTNGSAITYTPATNYKGADAFNYTISDGFGGTAIANVSVNVPNRNPTAGGDSLNTYENTAKTFDPRGNDNDPDGDAVSISSVGGPSHGSTSTDSSSITYTPASGYTGPDAFSYTIADGYGGSATATVNVAVNTHPPVAVDDYKSVKATKPGFVLPLANDSDPDGDALTIFSVGYNPDLNPTIVNGNQITFDTTGASGSFSYTISDGHGGTATAVVYVTINP